MKFSRRQSFPTPRPAPPGFIAVPSPTTREKKIFASGLETRPLPARSQASLPVSIRRRARCDLADEGNLCVFASRTTREEKRRFPPVRSRAHLRAGPFAGSVEGGGNGAGRQSSIRSGETACGDHRTDITVPASRRGEQCCPKGLNRTGSIRSDNALTGKRAPADQVGGLFRDHHRRRLGIARHDRRHDRGVGDP